MHQRVIPGIAACLAATLPLNAQTNPDAGELTHGHASQALTSDAFESWRTDNGGNWQMRFDPKVGQARFVFGGKAEPVFRPSQDSDYFSLARHVLGDTAGGLHFVDASTLVESAVRFIPMGAAGGTDKLAVEFRQVVHGVEVLGGWVNALFDLDGHLLALDIQAQPNMQGFPTAPSIAPERALAIAERTFEHDNGLPINGYGQPKLVILQQERDDFRVPMLAWQVAMGHESEGSEPLGTLYSIDAFLGTILDRETTVHYLDVTGTATSNVTPGTSPDTGSNPPAQQPIPHLRITNNQALPAVYTNAAGFFNIVGATPGVQMTINYDGLYTNTNNSGAGGQYSLTQTLPQGSGNVVLMNPTPSEFLTAQANSAIWINGLRDWIRATNPGDATADFVALSNVNISSSCNAFFNGNSVNFFRALGGCVNTAYSTVVAHEMGHWLNVRYGTGNGGDGIGEGIADVFGNFLTDDPIIGKNFCGTGCHIRDANNTRQFCGDCCGGCHGGVHANGEVIMGAMWKVRRNLKSSLGNSAGAALADGLFSGWNNVYNQTQIKNIIVEQWLTLDDNDGNIMNGTPHYGDIQSGFEEQGFPGFKLTFFDITNVTDLPDTSDEAGPYVVDADVVATLNPPVTSVAIRYSLNGGSYASAPMTNIGGDSYRGSIPGQVCSSVVSYYIEATDGSGNNGTFPFEAPDDFLSFFIGNITLSFTDDFETNKNWTVSSNAQDGDWERGVPVNDPNWAYDPVSDSDGSGKCFVTSNQLGDSDVDGGFVTLLSPKLDMSTGGQFQYDYFLRLTSVGGNDRLRVQISSTGAFGPWTLLADHNDDGGLAWRTQAFSYGELLDAGVSFTNNMFVRFQASDFPPDAIAEMGLDAFKVMVVDCSQCADPVQYCTAKPGLVCGVPAIDWSGQSSAGATSGFNIFAGPALGLRSGSLLYGNAGQSAIPFQGGLLCVNPTSLFRSVTVNSGGTQGNCDGTFSLDMNAFASGQLGQNPQPFLQQIGAVVNVQMYGRDSVPTGSFLSDALEYVVCP